MRNKPRIWGGIGTAVAALCCFTPLLVWGLPAVGLASLALYLDRILLPLLAFFILLTAYGFFRARRRRSCAPDSAQHITSRKGIYHD